MQEHLIVDGNNAIHAIPQLAKELPLDRSRARESLLHLLEPLNSLGAIRLTVVFDGRGGPQSVTQYKRLPDYTIIFSSSVEGADGVIERMVMASKQPQCLTIVTNDSLIRNCAYSHGAAAMKVEEMVKKLDHSIEVSKSVRKMGLGKSRQDGPFENRIPFPDM